MSDEKIIDILMKNITSKTKRSLEYAVLKFVEKKLILDLLFNSDETEKLLKWNVERFVFHNKEFFEVLYACRHDMNDDLWIPYFIKFDSETLSMKYYEFVRHVCGEMRLLLLMQI